MIQEADRRIRVGFRWAVVWNRWENGHAAPSKLAMRALGALADAEPDPEAENAPAGPP
jgi:hypothetical protein